MLVHVVAVRSIFQPLGACYGLLVNFLAIWYVVPRKIWQPWVHLGEIFWDQVADFFFCFAVASLFSWVVQPHIASNSI
jgi:hypothetical protein